MYTNLEKIANPTKYYQHPDEVKNDSSLSNEEKLKLLINWRDDETLKSIATNENMPSTNNSDNNHIAIIEQLIAYYQS